MHGGKRENAGRKAVLESEKKVGCQIYLTPVQREEIEQYAIGNSFSEKCVSLITKQLEIKKSAQFKCFKPRSEKTIFTNTTKLF